MSKAIKYNKHTLSKLEEIYKQNEYTIRYERGNFNAGYCILENKNVIVINKFYDTEARINCLIDILSEIEISTAGLDDKLQLFYVQLTQKELPL